MHATKETKERTRESIPDPPPRTPTKLPVDAPRLRIPAEPAALPRWLPFRPSRDKRELSRLFTESHALLMAEREATEAFLRVLAGFNGFPAPVPLPHTTRPRLRLPMIYGLDPGEYCTRLAEDLLAEFTALAGDLATALAVGQKQQQHGSVTFPNPAACIYTWHSYRVGAERQVGHRTTTTREGWTSTHRTERDFERVHRHVTHEGDLIDAYRTAIDDPGAFVPARIRDLCSHAPRWLRGHLSFVFGTETHERVLERDVKTERRTETEVHLFRHDPVLAIGEVVLTGWDQAEADQEWAVLEERRRRVREEQERLEAERLAAEEAARAEAEAARERAAEWERLRPHRERQAQKGKVRNAVLLVWMAAALTLTGLFQVWMDRLVFGPGSKHGENVAQYRAVRERFARERKSLVFDGESLPSDPQALRWAAGIAVCSILAALSLGCCWPLAGGCTRVFGCDPPDVALAQWWEALPGPDRTRVGWLVAAAVLCPILVGVLIVHGERILAYVNLALTIAFLLAAVGGLAALVYALNRETK